MRTIILTSIIMLFITMVNAQEIEATTASGKKVMLNIGNYSWRYSNPQDGQNPCYTNYTADVTIDNKTNNDIYFHYVTKTNGSYGIGVAIKVQANSKRIIERLYTKRWYAGNTGYDIINYEWKVAYEQFGNLEGWHPLDIVKGFDAGSFILQECEPKKIEIFD